MRIFYLLESLSISGNGSPKDKNIAYTENLHLPSAWGTLSQISCPPGQAELQAFKPCDHDDSRPPNRYPERLALRLFPGCDTPTWCGWWGRTIPRPQLGEKALLHAAPEETAKCSGTSFQAARQAAWLVNQVCKSVGSGTKLHKGLFWSQDVLN